MTSGLKLAADKSLHRTGVTVCEFRLCAAITATHCSLSMFSLPRRLTLPLQWQVYGRNRGSASAKGRWLARGVETLLFQYPGLRVAFLDEAPGGRQYSVFIRGTGAPPKDLNGQTDEIYRCCDCSVGERVRVRARAASRLRSTSCVRPTIKPMLRSRLRTGLR